MNNILNGKGLENIPNSVTVPIIFISSYIVLSIIIYAIEINKFRDEMISLDVILENYSFMAKYLYTFNKYSFFNMFILSVWSGLWYFFVENFLTSAAFVVIVVAVALYLAFYVTGIFRYPEWPFNFPNGWKKEPEPITNSIKQEINNLENNIKSMI